MSDDPPTTRLPRVGAAPPIWPTVDPDAPVRATPVIPRSVWRLAWAAAERVGPLVWRGAGGNRDQQGYPSRRDLARRRS